MSGEDNRFIGETPLSEIVDKPQGGKSNIILDATVLTTLMTCPRLTDFRFNHHLQSIKGKSNSLECGLIVHKFLEIYYQSIILGVDRQKAFGFGMAAAELYVRSCEFCTGFIATPEQPKPACGHKPDDYPGLRNTPPDNEGYKIGWKWALTTCEQYHEHYRSDHWVPLEVETVKGKVLYEDDDLRVLWKAKLDWVVDTNQGVFPVDHKTMKQRRPTIKLNNQFKGQCLVMGTRNVIINKVGFQQSLKPAEKFERPPISYSAAALTEWYSETLPFYAKMLLMYAEMEYYPPNYSNCEGKYGLCPFKEVCESDPGMREEELRNNFVVGPVWNPTNDDSEE